MIRRMLQRAHRRGSQRGFTLIEVLVPDSERLDRSVSRIRFLPDGSTSGARIVLKDETTTATVYVDWLNGDVRVHLRP